MNMELERQAKPRGFLQLPQEIRTLIYSYLIPTDKLFIFLLVKDKPDSCTFDHFSFDRGYAFPLFETSIFRVCQVTYTEANDLWLRKGHFRLEMGEDLGPRNPRWTISDHFISRMAHCDLTITVPFWPWQQEINGVNLGNWMLRRFLRRIIEAIVKGKSLRQTQIIVRDVPKHACHVIHSDRIPVSFVKYITTNILLPIACFDAFESVEVQDDVALIKWPLPPELIYASISWGMQDQFLWEMAKLAGNSGGIGDSQVEKEIPKTGKVYDVQVIRRDRPMPTAIIPTEARLFQAYFDGEWYVWIR
jgi:hypothetical protein